MLKDAAARQQLESTCAHMCEKGYGIAVGRAASGMVAVLMALKNRFGASSNPLRLALPAFLCQSPLGAAVYAGWQPVLCDVNACGHVPLETWLEAIEQGANAILVVHMFGIPSPQIATLRRLCDEKRVFLLEDACLALGAYADNKPCGFWGHASFFSFGHTKLIDVGGGGMVLTNDEFLADEIRSGLTDLSLHLLDPQTRSSQEQSFLRAFYQAKDLLLTNTILAKEQFQKLLPAYLPLVPRAWEAAWTEPVLQQLGEVPDRIHRRLQKVQLYREHLTGPVVPLPFVDSRPVERASPWRFAFRLPGLTRAHQEHISNTIRASNIPVSNWYLPLPWLLPQHTKESAVPGTEQLSQEIFQLWLDEQTTPEMVVHTAQTVSRIVKDNI